MNTRPHHGKTVRRPYRKSRAFDTRCRSHGVCPVCYANRMYSTRKSLVYCIHCEARTGDYVSEPEAITAWNRRTPDVVRCGECKYWLRSSIEKLVNCDIAYCKKLGDFEEEDFYCAYGERMEEE